MKHYTSNNIFNIPVAGYSGRGKTSLVEAMMYLSKGLNRLRNIAD